MTQPIGGQLIGGGWINQSPLGSVVSGTDPWAASYQRGIPLRECRLAQTYMEKPLHISGLLGAATSRRYNFQGIFQFTLWYDQSNPIEPATVQLPSFRQRDPFQLVFLMGVDYMASIAYRAYYAPIAVADTVTPVWDEESNPRKVIGEEVTGHTRGWTFLLPDDGDPGNSGTLVGAYLYYITHAGAALI